jgi:transcriptional regulator with XRE-family HTH domain
MRSARKEHRMSQSFLAHQLGLSRDQIERMERGSAAIRFFPAWSFCRLSGINPLWLAFGDPEAKYGFIECANSTVPSGSLFADVMRTYGKRYRVYRFLNQSAAFESGAVFSDQPSMLTADYIKLGPPDPLQFEVPKNLIGKLAIKHSLRPTMTWQELRAVLRSETETPTAKAALASFLGVSLAAVSQWRSGASAPTAEKVLRILDWLRSPSASLQKTRTPRPRKSATAANPKGKSANDKPNSGRKKK